MSTAVIFYKIENFFCRIRTIRYVFMYSINKYIQVVYNLHISKKDLRLLNRYFPQWLASKQITVFEYLGRKINLCSLKSTYSSFQHFFITLKNKKQNLCSRLTNCPQFLKHISIFQHCFPVQILCPHLFILQIK